MYSRSICSVQVYPNSELKTRSESEIILTPQHHHIHTKRREWSTAPPGAHFVISFRHRSKIFFHNILFCTLMYGVSLFDRPLASLNSSLFRHSGHQVSPPWWRPSRKIVTSIKIRQSFSHFWHHNVQEGTCCQNYQPLRHVWLVNSLEWMKATNPIISTCRCWHQHRSPLLHRRNNLDRNHGFFQLLCSMPIQSACFSPQHQFPFQAIRTFPLKSWVVLRQLPWTTKAFHRAMTQLMNYWAKLIWSGFPERIHPAGGFARSRRR